MTKKVRQWRGRSKTTSSIIKTINKDNFAGAICPTNVEEQKQRFLTLGKTPEFTHRGTTEELEEIYSKPRSEIRFSLLGEAIHILKLVKEQYGDAENYYTEMYGDVISKEEATDIIVDYLKENHLDGAMSIIWCTDLPCSGRMMWQGPHMKYKRPEARKYSMWIKDAKDNNFLREKGMRCLADHEIGTHFFRSRNDGLQPWFAERDRFGIRGLSGLDQLRTEEGLAAINTILNAKVRYLWGPALLYYIACKATELTFKQLFEHLSIYVANPDWRWRHCVRVKRGLLNPNDIGGYGKDQCYFEGAVEILRNIDTIDFKVLMSGKICYDEVQRVKKLARTDCIQLPAFMRNQEKYKKSLKQIAHMNGLTLEHAKYKAPVAYLRRLKRGRRIGVAGGINKVRKKGKQGDNSGDGVYTSTGSAVGSDEEMSLSDDEQLFFNKFNHDENKVGADNTFTSIKMSRTGANGIETEADYTDYLKTVVSNYEKLKTEKIEAIKPVTEPSHKMEVKEEPTREPGLENNQDHYRCLSRGSIRSILNQPSCSLGSRGKSSSIDPMSIMTRRGSGSGPESVISALSMTAQSNILKHSSTAQTPISCQFDRYNLNKNATLPSPPLSNPTLLKHLTPLGTPLVTPHSTAYGTSHTTPHSTLHTTTPSTSHLTPLGTSTVSMASLIAHNGVLTHSKSSTGLSKISMQCPTLTKAASSNDVINTQTEGFIYPNNDILTEDIIQIKDGNQLYQSNTEMTKYHMGTSHNTESASQVKLLTRRVKSAANVLPKLQN